MLIRAKRKEGVDYATAMLATYDEMIRWAQSQRSAAQTIIDALEAVNPSEDDE